MSRYFIIEVKDKHITRHEIFLALVEKLGLGVVVTVEPASQQPLAPDANVSLDWSGDAGGVGFDGTDNA